MRENALKFARFFVSLQRELTLVHEKVFFHKIIDHVVRENGEICCGFLLVIDFIFVPLQKKSDTNCMKKIFSIMVMVLAVCFTGCKDNNDSLDEPIKKPYFYVRYHADHWATVDFNKTCTMTITDENGQEASYTIGSRDVIIGPVYTGFTTKMTVSAPYDGGNDGSISIARNSDFYFVTYASFANSKKAETLTYTIKETTGKLQEE